MGTVKGWRPRLSPLTRIPVEGAESVTALTKGDGVGRRPVCAHRIKSKNNLTAVLRPMAMLDRVVFTNEQRGEDRGAIRSQVESKDTFRRVGRGRMPLVSA